MSIVIKEACLEFVYTLVATVCRLSHIIIESALFVRIECSRLHYCIVCTPSHTCMSCAYPLHNALVSTHLFVLVIRKEREHSCRCRYYLGLEPASTHTLGLVTDDTTCMHLINRTVEANCKSRRNSFDCIGHTKR